MPSRPRLEGSIRMELSRRSLILGAAAASAAPLIAPTAARADTGLVTPQVAIDRPRNGSGKLYAAANSIRRWSYGHRAHYGLYSGHDANPGPSAGNYLSCSGLTRWAGKIAFGYDYFGRYNYNIGQYYNSNGTFLASSSYAIPGDFVFYDFRPGDRGYVRSLNSTVSDHVAIYMGGGQVFHCFKYGSRSGLFTTSMWYFGSHLRVKRFYY